MSAALVDHCLELLAPLGAARAKRMFGGWGLYLDELFIAVIVEDRVYLKADAQTRPRFEAAGCEQWVYDDGKGKTVAMSYWSVPAEVMESPQLMQPWARQAMEAALRARAAKASAPARKPRAARPKAPATRSRTKR
jgi:DNA transformation protein